MLQTSPSIDCTDDQETDMRELLTRVEREGIELAWEPRGDWPEHADRVRTICADLDLIHVVDLLRDTPTFAVPRIAAKHRLL